MRIFLIGFMGSGKTTWGRQLAESLQLQFVDLDAEIEQKEGKKISELFHLHGEIFFRRLEASCLRECVLKDDFVMACGGGTPCFHDNMALLNTRGITIWLNPPVEVLVERLAQDNGVRPLLKEMDADQRRSYIVATLAQRKEYYQQAKLAVDTSQLNIEYLIHEIKSL